ncbi:MAG TPA: conjugal transfer protein TraI [Puia sp.]|nr:conjugal transfer protein TraI [Puia sp.]
MRKRFVAVLLMTILLGAIPVRTNAQFAIADIIKLVLTKVINAIDLAVQQVQNKTIVLQNAQKELENTMSELQLNDIADWVEKQRKLYAAYYQELWEVKQVISDYDKVKSIVQMQSRIVSEYNQANSLFSQDKHFTASELNHMGQVYAGILNASLQNLNQALLVVNALVTQMDDAGRMKIIDQASAGMQKNYNDLKQFNQQNVQLSLQRTQGKGDIETVKILYGLE